MKKNAPLGIVSLLLVSAALLFLFFTILAGVTNSTPLNKTYFLRADTSGITGARQTTQWTYFYFCGRNNNNCGQARPAPAFGRAWAGRANNVPDGLGGTHGGHTTSFHFYYMWRFGWVFYLMAITFAALAFFGSFLACCGRLGSAIAGFLSFVALIFLTVAASLMTATFVQARNRFQSDGRSASLGRWAFGWTWGAWAALFLATLLFCIGTRGDKGSSSGGRNWRGWRRRRSVRSRSYDGRRVKDDYS